MMPGPLKAKWLKDNFKTAEKMICILGSRGKIPLLFTNRIGNVLLLEEKWLFVIGRH